MAQYFQLTLDTTAPTSGSSSVSNYYYGTNPSVTISASSASFMKVWTSTSATGSTSDTNFPSAWSVYATSATATNNSQGTNYVHAMFMDEVGNISAIVDSSAYVFDNVAPSISAVSINDGALIAIDPEVTVRVTFSDATSGVDSITLSGDLDGSATTSFSVSDADRTAGYKDCETTLSSGDGTKTVTAVVTDRCGNESASANDSIVLDTTISEATVVISRTEGGSAAATCISPSVYVDITSPDADLVKYKIWNDNDSEPASWTEGTWTADSETPPTYHLWTAHSLTDSDGTRTVNVKVMDAGGNVVSATQTIVLDQVAPTGSLSVDTTIISAQTGFDTVTFTLTATDATSGTENYALKIGDDTLKSGTFTSGMTVAVTEAEIVALSAGEGTKSIVFYCTDVAGNVGTIATQVITVDLTAPTGSVTTDDYYKNGQTPTATLSATDTGGSTVAQMMVWVDSATGTWETYSASKALTGLSDGEHTVYAKFKDAVGNISSDTYSDTFFLDTVAPTATPTCPAYTNTTTVTVTLGASDASPSSGLAFMKVYDAAGTASEWEAYASTKTITLASETDGVHTINVYVKDTAGNESALATCSTVFDNDVPAPTLVLRNTADTANIPANVNVRGFIARIGYTEAEQTAPIVSYKLYGDFDQTSNEWQDMPAFDTGKTYATISSLTFTSTEGEKTISLLLKDAAGNITSTAATYTTIYDVTLPVITVSDVDYNVISLQTSARLNPSTAAEITGTACNKMTFKFQADEALQAWKVCINESEQEAATAEAIPTTGGSINTSGTSVAAETDVLVTIMGADFVSAGADADGAYEVIVYGQDLAGTWSASHTITA